MPAEIDCISAFDQGLLEYISYLLYKYSNHITFQNTKRKSLKVRILYFAVYFLQRNAL